MASNATETQNPKDPKNKHLHHLWPYIVASKNFSPYGPALQNPFPLPKEDTLQGEKKLELVFKWKNFQENFSIDEFRDYLVENIDEICKELSTRWLCSVCEVLADCSEDVEEKLAALYVPIVVRITQGATANMKHRNALPPEYTDKMFREHGEIRSKFKGKYYTWDGVHCIEGIDGVYTNLFKRMKINIEKYSHLYKIFQRVIQILLDNKTSFIPYENTGPGPDVLRSELREALDIKQLSKSERESARVEFRYLSRKGKPPGSEEGKI